MTKTALETRPETVLVRNVFYLMSYAFRALDVRDYEKIGSEEFEGMDDLLAAILLIGVESQRRRGFEKDYKRIDEEGWRIKGRIDMRQTMELSFASAPSAAYGYDEYDEDTQLNRILKTSLLVLLGSENVQEGRRRRLRSAVAFMQGISTIDDPSRIRWSQLRYHRNNRSYELLMNVCYLVIKQHLMDPQSSEYNLASFDDKQWFSALYENFILNYFKRHYPSLHVAGQKSIRPSESAPSFVPSMFTDVSISNGERTLIIDAKCYGRIFSMNYDKEIMSADHIRQIYYYATHTGSPERVSAMLVYAGTSERQVSEYWDDGGYQLGCKTLCLNTDFSTIATGLDAVIEDTFGQVERQ